MNLNTHSVRTEIAIVCLIFLFSLLIYGLFAKDYVLSPNEASRLAMVFSLVEQKTLSIDQTPFIWTIDKIRVKGHYYSDKPPLLTLLMTGYYVLLKNVGQLSLTTHLAEVYYGLVLFFSVGPSALLLVAVYICLKKFQIPVALRIVICFLTGFATLQFPYSLVLNNHIQAALVVTLLFLVSQILEHSIINYSSERDQDSSGFRSSIMLYLLFGLLIGYGIAIDHLSGIIFAFVFLLNQVFILWKAAFSYRQKIQLILYLIIGMGPLLYVHFLFNYLISGSFIPLSQQYEAYVYPGSYLAYETPAGKLAHAHPGEMASYLFHLLVGKRGLFSYTPLLLFGLIALIRSLPCRRELRYSVSFWFLIGVLLTIGEVVLVTKNFGGSAYGVRWFVPFTPILMCYLALFVHQLRWNWFWIILACLTCLVSLITAWVGVYEPWTQLQGNDFTFLNNLREMQAQWKF